VGASVVPFDEHKASNTAGHTYGFETVGAGPKWQSASLVCAMTQSM